MIANPHGTPCFQDTESQRPVPITDVISVWSKQESVLEDLNFKPNDHWQIVKYASVSFLRTCEDALVDVAAFPRNAVLLNPG